MTEVAGVWEMDWNTPIKEADLWAFPLRDLGTDRWFMAPVSGIEQPGVTEMTDLGPLIEERRAAGVRVVFVDEHGAVPLPDFTHPEEVLYVFGRSGLSTLRAYGTDEDASVRIPTAEGKGLLWAHQAAAIILYDRMQKCL